MKKIKILNALFTGTILSLLIISCSENKTNTDTNATISGNQEKKIYNLIIGTDTIPLTLQKKLQNGFYKLGADMNLTYVQAKNDEPEDPLVLAPEHDLFKQQNPNMTYAVNFTVDDIGGFYNTLLGAAAFDHKTVDSFRVKFIVYDHAPTIRGSVRQDYRGKVSAALFGMSGGVEYVTTNKPNTDIRPRNLGTICPVCQ